MGVEKKFYSVSEFAKILGISRATVYLWIKKGILKAVTLPTGILRIPKEELDRILNSKEEE